VLQYLPRREPLACHDGGAYLAEAHTVTPPGPVKDEAFRHTVGGTLYRYDKCAAEQMAWGEPSAYLKLFSDDDALF